ncbi:MAG TPA: PP2C family protein-serine/threonine phosphatase [Solirubrobacteraceae bacterium]|nr:PP2C family protein-serine/threonine phosphatase [Solirubrobacteraceae bacterium]
MSACVVLVAALAVQPALGKDGNGRGKGKEGSQAAPAAAAAAPAATSAPRVRSAKSGPSAKRGPSPKSGNRRATRQVEAPAAAAAPAADPTPPPAADPAPTPPPAPPVVPVPGDAAGPEDGDNGASPPMTAPTPPAVEAPAAAPPPPAAVEEQPGRSPAAPAAARPEAPAPQNAVGPADRETIQAAPALVVTSQPPAQATADVASLSPPAATDPAAPPLAPPADGTTAGDAAGNAGTQSPGADAGRAQANPLTGAVRSGPALATDATTGGTAPATPLSEPLNTPASAAIVGVGVRELGGVVTSQPPANATGAVRDLDQPGTVASALRGVIKVVPDWVWVALAVLGALVLALGAHSILAAARTRRLERQREKLMEDIGLLQAALLPAVPSRMGALLTTVAYRPADGPAAGGDFYDAFALPDGRVGLLLGDVSGHGRQALAKTTLVRFSVRAHLEAGMSPREAISIAGRSLDGRLADDFSTVLAAIHDPATGTLTYASAGHPPPLVLGPSAHAPLTASSAPPIGVGFPTGQRQTILPMPEGTTVAVYSDGLLEARIDGQPLGAERLAQWLEDLGPDATAKDLLDLVVQRADRVPDDLAAVVLHAAPGATAPASRIEQLKLDVLDTEGPDLDGFLSAAGVGRAERATVGRRVAEQLAVSGGVIVELRTGEHPTVNVLPLGDVTSAGERQRARAR